MVEKEEEKDGDDYKKKMKIDYMINFVLDK